MPMITGYEGVARDKLIKSTEGNAIVNVPSTMGM